MANVTLTWAANPAAEMVTKYRVWEAVNGNYEYPNLLGETSETTFVVTDHAPGLFSWAITAVNLAGESAISDWVAGPALPSKPATPEVSFN